MFKCAFSVSDGGQNPQCVHTVVFVQSELVIPNGYLPHLQSLLHKIPSLCFLAQCFPVELWWKYSNKKRNFGSKQTVALKDIYLI